MEVASLRGSIRVAIVEEGYPNLCFWGDNVLETLEDVVSVAFLPHGRVRTSTVGKVRALGYEPYRSEPWPHLTIRFEDEPTDTALVELRWVFEKEVPNPRPAG